MFRVGFRVFRVGFRVFRVGFRVFRVGSGWGSGCSGWVPGVPGGVPAFTDTRIKSKQPQEILCKGDVLLFWRKHSGLVFIANTIINTVEYIYI